MAKQWFVLRVQSGREESVKEGLWKRIQTNDLQELISRLLIPVEKISEIKGGERRTVERKIYPGYLMAEIDTDEKGDIPEDVWFLIKETPGVGDFVGSYRKPMPMSQDEVDKMLVQAERIEEAPKIKIDFERGSNVKIKEGPFENFDGVVDEVYPQKGLVKVIVTIFGRPTPVELEYWQVEAV